MSTRSTAVLAASLALLVSLAVAAAPTQHRSRRDDIRSRTSGPALIVRGDQVSTEGLVDAVARAYAATGEGRLEVQPFNTIDGIDQALSGQVDMAAVARPPDPARAQEAGLTYTPVAWDALVMITNTANPVANLTLKQIHEIYYGKITNWSKVGGPDEHIDLEGVFPKLDGVQFSFRRLLFGNGDNPVAVPRLLVNIDSLQADVALDPRALALSTLAHARNQKGIRIIPIEGVMPSLATLENASYPLPLTIYLAYKADSPKIAQIRKFLAFLEGSVAGGILRDRALLPYGLATVLNAKTELDRINAIGARMVAEGLPPEYAPGNEFARIAAQYPDLEHTMHLQQLAAQQVARADAQRVALSDAAGVNPSPDAAPAPPVRSASYTVVSGDTLSKIARDHSVSIEDLRKWNHLRSDMLQVGQDLRVAAPNS